LETSNKYLKEPVGQAISMEIFTVTKLPVPGAGWMMQA
jgi:hypothetical protein